MAKNEPNASCHLVNFLFIFFFFFFFYLPFFFLFFFNLFTCHFSPSPSSSLLGGKEGISFCREIQTP